MGESRKVTYQLSAEVISEVREAVNAGYASSMSRFVEDAMRQRLRDIRDERIRDALLRAASDPQVERDVAAVESVLDAIETMDEL
ncbi:MAG: hypothetical protein EA427_17170 [Spirochaetaceae bacterium]|nr:MAG: hypothetical protein EA427_17170 [Spirochaetaceae bacterium]